MKAVVVGRHAGEIPGIEVLEQVSPQYPADSAGTQKVLSSMFEEIYCKYFLDACVEDSVIPAVVFQACPAQLCVALHKLIASDNCRINQIGFVVSVPGERPAGVTKEWNMSDGNMFDNVAEAVEIVKHCNPTAKIETTSYSISVTVDRPMQFRFSHIEWLTEEE